MAYTGQEVLLRWDDSVYGPQKGAATGGLSDDQFYPDCGTMRNYPLENINYDLEKVIVPQLDSIIAALASGGATLEDVLGKQNTTTGDVVLPAQPCKYVTLWILSSAAENVTITKNTQAIVLEKGYSITINTSDLSNLSIKSASGGVTVYYSASTVV